MKDYSKLMHLGLAGLLMYGAARLISTMLDNSRDQSRLKNANHAEKNLKPAGSPAMHEESMGPQPEPIPEPEPVPEPITPIEESPENAESADQT